jgi:hypothetical protein
MLPIDDPRSAVVVLHQKLSLASKAITAGESFCAAT